MKILVRNKTVSLNYDVVERYEAGIVLLGSEVKSLKEGAVSLKNTYATIKKGEVLLQNAHISAYKHAFSKEMKHYDPMRVRKLLLHKSEILKIALEIQGGNFTLIPTMIYIKNNKIKVELALARGKKKFDKREAIKEKEYKIEMRRKDKKTW